MARFVKGSEEAKAYMASIRGKKKAPSEEKMEMMEKKKNPKKARATKGSEEAKEMMARVRSAKKK